MSLARRFRAPALRRWPRRVLRAWRSSLQFRAVAITVLLSGIAIGSTGAYLSYSISDNLFQSRLDQVTGDTSRATRAAQGYLDAATVSTRQDMEEVMNSVRTAVRDASSSALIAVVRAPDQEASSLAPQDSYNRELQNGVISDDLRARVQAGADGQYWQSVSLGASGQQLPGIVVGSTIELPSSAGRYELYIGYSLADAERTLQFVQQVLNIAGILLILLIGAVSWVVVRIVVAPVRVAAETSQRLAAGDFDVRIPERGQDVIATLARSFNGMADSLQEQISELATLSRVQQRFVSDVSHELRTPLTTMKLAGDVLYDQREGFPPVAERTVELLHGQIGRFESLLADLLEISRHDAGSAELELEPVNLVRLAGEEIEGMRGIAEANGSRLTLSAPGGYFDAEMDARRIRRIVRNLLGNAVEHGDGREIVVTVDSNATAVALAVRDYGHGMSSEEVVRVFDRFWRADPSRRRTLGGTGLGLSIAQEDTALHHGWLQVWSMPGRGACFRLTVPRRRGERIDASPLPLPPVDAGEQAYSGPIVLPPLPLGGVPEHGVVQ
ncbi:MULTISPECIES: MtrAB system histidine kinase MtrB [Rathayibacter]|uniref:MtrAB system histidine kinase MtrB n=1 Tax=Rathayibacter TaxID=33886 RepID=UPI000F996AD0|nr:MULTISPECIES: MtrAB system histidine kinase MtrB [Rathayibacter]MCJ1672776.1 MtrAB system histidine kinase MtrB [Rathayibacter sp. VKM Ac-2929]MCJ1682255.1 MtrAB system histidine kinase MtrB [Rathayibacter sp. VKM Ac-2928]MCJ1685802.1 MtrAB system histidine kinase MtrB [Rathayibacter sp. VKM Ac-2927]MCJ1699513.1 MtrAB system histidine kinase MtrB [Rathayibacter festucae]MCJ1704824.1 MtrAB system histidine kinase MtrB [Rathayibacter sp. VKM Ac-2926]